MRRSRIAYGATSPSPDAPGAEIGLPKTADDSFILTDDDTIESVLAQYRQVSGRM